MNNVIRFPMNEMYGRHAYETYSTEVGGISVTGDRLPTWDELSSDPNTRHIAEAWRKTAVELVKKFVREYT